MKDHDQRMRHGTTKVKTGCLMCKTRRVKCDETKPECLKCLKARRTCPGYAQPSNHFKLVQYVSDSPKSSVGVLMTAFDGIQLHQCETYSTRATDVYHPHSDGRIGRQTPASYASTTLHPSTLSGYRRDFFCSFPVDIDYESQRAFDHILVWQFRGMSPRSQSMWQNFLLQDPLIFETTIAYSMITKLYDLQPKARLTPTISKHLAHVMPRLQERLHNNSELDNRVVILSIYNLLLIYQAAGDYDAFGVHLEGLRHVFALRQTIGPSTWDGFIKARMDGAELAALYFTGPGSHIAEAHTRCQKALDYTSPLHAAKHGSRIERLPSTWQRLAVSGTLSVQSIDFLEFVQNMRERYNGSALNDFVVQIVLRMIESADITDTPGHAILLTTVNGKP